MSEQKIRLTKKDYDLINKFMATYKVEKGSGYSLLLEMFLEFSKEVKSNE